MTKFSEMSLTNSDAALWETCLEAGRTVDAVKLDAVVRKVEEVLNAPDRSPVVFVVHPREFEREKNAVARERENHA